MLDAPNRRRRFLQFGLGTMLVVLMVLAISLGQVKLVRDRQQLRAFIDKNGGHVVDTADFPSKEQPDGSKDVRFWRRWLGDSHVSMLSLPDNLDLENAARLFPEARICPYPAIPFPTMREVKEVELEFGFGNAKFDRLHIIDPKLIKSTVVQPLQNSKGVDPRTLIALGTLRLRYEDGSTEELGVFRPWGFWSQQGNQYFGELTELRDACREAVQNSGSPEAATLINDPMYWE